MRNPLGDLMDNEEGRCQDLLLTKSPEKGILGQAKVPRKNKNEELDTKAMYI